jgi:NTE family protein
LRPIHTDSRPGPRIGLVLGAGGVVGASYLAGALEGLRRATGWEPARAEVIVGTSAGAFIGAIAAIGLPPALMYARCTGEEPEGHRFPEELVLLAERMDRHNHVHWIRRYLPHARVPRPFFSSPRLALDALRSRGSARIAMLATGLLGEGLLSTHRSIGAVIRTAIERGWTTRAMWVVAFDLDSGRRVVFGKEGAPATDLHVAVSAATAIPGVFAPVTIAGHRHCDAGLWSPSNLDVLEGQGLDAVVCINPLSGGSQLPSVAMRGAVHRSLRHLGRLVRVRFDARLADERAKVERSGTEVFVLHPSAEEIARFPFNSMDLASRPAIMRRAADATARYLTQSDDGIALARLLERSAGAAPQTATCSGCTTA